MAKVASTRAKKRQFHKQPMLQVFALLGMAYLLVFNYLPMVGIVMAFKDFTIDQGISGIFTSHWVGLKHFFTFVQDINFTMIIRNTVMLSVLKLIFTFPMPILFAVMLNEVNKRFFKRFTQTVSYLPHFISWVIISGLAISFFSADGVINTLLLFVGIIQEPIKFLTSPNNYWPLAVFLDMWKDMGWWAI
ncbi:MAG: sugar ABC transporter permease, partial [Acetanaerobacterium sp.]